MDIWRQIMASNYYNFGTRRSLHDLPLTDGVKN